MRALVQALLLAAVFATIAFAGQPDEAAIDHIYSAGWMQFGRVEHATDISHYDYNRNWIFQEGALVGFKASFGPRLTAGGGAGVASLFPALCSNQSGEMHQIVVPFITEAQIGYSQGDDHDFSFQTTAGFFPYNYDPDSRNLGAYLFRGSVYPGFLYSGFDANEMVGLATVSGLKLTTTIRKDFRQDLVFSIETALKPYFDVSIGYVADLKITKAFDVSAGVNFYHLISLNEKLTTPGKNASQSSDTGDPYNNNYYYVGPGNDTVVYTNRGTKLMGRLSFEPLKAFESNTPEIDGPNDRLKIYAEAAIIGLENYQYAYDDLSQRIPVMIGVTVPTFRILDLLAFEIEYYKCPYRNDPYKNLNTPLPSPLPRPNGYYDYRVDTTTVHFNPNDDDVKWSVYASRDFGNHIRLTGQIANDHMRMGGSGFYPSSEEAFTSLKDWYWMLKCMYLF
jgi:hypothetical protein